MALNLSPPRYVNNTAVVILLLWKVYCLTDDSEYNVNVLLNVGADLSRVRHQVVIWTNDDLFSFRPNSKLLYFETEWEQ